jgi:hypothetical protein
MYDPPMSYLEELDQIKAAIQRQHPGWHVWFVPKLNKDGSRSATWCAHPWPLVNAQTPEHLIAELRKVHEEADQEWPAVCDVTTYAIRRQLAEGDGAGKG